MTTRVSLAAILTAALIVAALPNPALSSDLRTEVERAIELFEKTDPGLAALFDSSYGYAVFPKIAKGAFGVGGAHGKGLAYQGGKLVGGTSLSQFTVGLALGGQVYQEVIFFENQTVFDSFTRGNFEFSAQVSAIAASAGASADAAYKHGVMVYTLGKQGLMYEASVGGQKFTFDRY